MNQDILKGNWNILKGKLKQTWANLTDDEILKMQGSEEELTGILQKKYGYTKDEAKKEVQRFIDNNLS